MKLRDRRYTAIANKLAHTKAQDQLEHLWEIPNKELTETEKVYMDKLEELLYSYDIKYG